MAFTHWDDVVRFCQALIQTPSLPGQEGEVAQLIQEEMKQLSYDEVWTDPVGNVIGLLRGDRDKPSICFTGHMDVVPPGDEKEWEHPPFSGAIADGFIHGRGTCDMKGAVATQVYVPELLRQSGVEHGDIYVIEVVQEEVGGLGSLYLEDDVKNKIDYAINGEPTTNQIYTGQKGRVELVVTFRGKAAHASQPWLGVNPIYDMGRFISKLEDLEENVKIAGEAEAKSTVAPTTCGTDTNTSNMIPGGCRLVLDWRSRPGESETQVLDKVRGLLPESGDAGIQEYELKTYTGLTLSMKRARAPFSIDKIHPLVKATAEAVKATLGGKVEFSTWTGATDCGYFMESGIPILGFSPGDVAYAHTTRERISLGMMEDTMRCYPAIVSNLAKLGKRDRR